MPLLEFKGGIDRAVGMVKSHFWFLPPFLWELDVLEHEVHVLRHRTGSWRLQRRGGPWSSSKRQQLQILSGCWWLLALRKILLFQRTGATAGSRRKFLTLSWNSQQIKALSTPMSPIPQHLCFQGFVQWIFHHSMKLLFSLNYFEMQHFIKKTLQGPL